MDSSLSSFGPCPFDWAEVSSVDTFEKVKAINDYFGMSLDDSVQNLAAIIDERGIRPSQPGVLAKSARSLFYKGKDVPEVVLEETVTTCALKVDSAKVFGFKEKSMAYGQFDLLPQMGIDAHGYSKSMFDEIDDMDVFGEFGDPFSDATIACCELNKVETFEPVQSLSSNEFKEVNEAVKRFQEGYQHLIFGNMLVVGAGKVTLARNFSYEKVKKITYVEPVQESCEELTRRLEKEDFRYQVICCTFDEFVKKNKEKFDVIVTNHSWHHVCEGKSPLEQLEKCKVLVEMLAPKGVWLGAGPSIGGMTSTPHSLEVRSNAGLYGFEKRNGSYVSISRFATSRYVENVFFSGVLYALDGKASVVHLSQFSTGEKTDLLRMYEGFVFMKGVKYPSGVVVSVDIDSQALEVLDFTRVVQVTIIGRQPKVVPIVSAVSEERSMTDHTTGQLLLANHLPHLFYSGPFLMSEKLDGELAYLERKDGVLKLFHRDKCFMIKSRKRGKREPDFLMAGELIGDEFWWLETIRVDGRNCVSWIAGCSAIIPNWVGIKSYVPLAAELPKTSEGIVIHDPQTPCGSGEIRQYFLKWQTTIDVRENGSVVEKCINGVLRNRDEEDHDPNGFVRALEGPFVVSDYVLRTWMDMRCGKGELVASVGETFTLDDILIYPKLTGTLNVMKARNTIVQQFWRGYLHLDSDTATFVSTYSPFGRMPDAMQMYGELLHAILSGESEDKDGILVRELSDDEEDKKIVFRDLKGNRLSPAEDQDEESDGEDEEDPDWSLLYQFGRS